MIFLLALVEGGIKKWESSLTLQAFARGRIAINVM
jgi:hypothetical protein